MGEKLLQVITANDPQVEKFFSRAKEEDKVAERKVKEILAAVRERGEEAVFAYTRLFDGVEINSTNLKVTPQEKERALQLIEPEFLAALRRAKEKIFAFHAVQAPRSWFQVEENGNLRGQIFFPLHRAGIYVPGGKAAYPSSVLMNAIPAQVAGVSEIIMVTPPAPDGTVNPYTLGAATEVGIEDIYKIGGAQAIAALAYGTQSIPKVEKITGPGNIYVAVAKKLVAGEVGTDLFAGPSEIFIVADASATPCYIAADLIAQAEHDPQAVALLATPAAELLAQVKKEVEHQLNNLPRREIAAQALSNYGALILTRDLEEAVELANRFAPEHLGLFVREPFFWLGKIRNAGAIFLGENTPVTVGDYYGGPNHILPTGGRARFASGLSVEDFLKKASVVAYSPSGLAAAAADIQILAKAEGLTGHAQAVTFRIKEGGKLWSG